MRVTNHGHLTSGKAVSSQNQALDLLLSKLDAKAVQQFEEVAVNDFFPGSTRNSKDLEQAGGRRMPSSFPTVAGEMGQVSSCRHFRTCLYLALMLIHFSCGLSSPGRGVVFFFLFILIHSESGFSEWVKINRNTALQVQRASLGR